MSCSCCQNRTMQLLLFLHFSCNNVVQVAATIAQQAADPNSLLRTGSITSAVTGVSVSQDILQQAAVAAGTTAQATAKPSYFRLCEPKSYHAFDMEMCYDCCSFKCETGNEVPAVNGLPVSACAYPVHWSGVCMIAFDCLHVCAPDTRCVYARCGVIYVCMCQGAMPYVWDAGRIYAFKLM
jgi:hypothetical protein